MRPLAILIIPVFIALSVKAHANTGWTIGANDPFSSEAVQSTPLLAETPQKGVFLAGRSFWSLLDGSHSTFFTNGLQGTPIATTRTWDKYVVGGHDFAKIYDASGKLASSLNAQDEPASLGPDAVSCAGFSPDDEILVTGGFKQVKVWRWAAQELLATILLPYHAIATKVGITADNDYLVIALKKFDANCCEYRGEIKIYRLSDLTEIRNEELPYPPALALSPLDSTIAHSSGASGIKIWNIKEALEVSLITENSGKVHALSFGPDGSMIASSCEDRTVSTWCSSSGRKLKYFRSELPVLNLVYTSDGGNLLLGENNSKISLLSVFKISIIAAGPNELKLKWEGGCGRYQVQARKLGESWQNLGMPTSEEEMLVQAVENGSLFRVVNAP